MKKKTAKDILKAVGYLAGSIGAGFIVEYAVKMVVPCNIKILKKALIFVGGAAIADIVGEAAGKNVAVGIDIVSGLINVLNSRAEGSENDI